MRLEIDVATCTRVSDALRSDAVPRRVGTVRCVSVSHILMPLHTDTCVVVRASPTVEANLAYINIKKVAQEL
jgi:hypothetical protein